MSAEKRKRTDLTLKEKKEIIDAAENQPNQSKLAREISEKWGVEVKRTTVKSILNMKDAIEVAIEAGFPSNRMKLVQTHDPKLDEAVLMWFMQAIEQNLPVNDDLIKEKAMELAELMHIQDFMASNCWLEFFKKRHGITFETVQSEDGPVDPQALLESLNQTPTQPYVKRNRPTGYSPNASNVNELYMNSAKLAPPNHGLSAVRAALALQQHRNTDDKKTMNFLAMIPRSSEVINITAGFSGEEEGGSSKNGTDNCTIDENGDECGVEMESRNGSGSGEIPTPSTSAQSNNQINAAAILSAAASNPFVYMAAANAIAANGMSSSDKRSTFSLMDGDSVVTLMRVAAELDCTFSFHCRDGQAHFCFETNQTAIDKIRGAEVSLVDVGSEVRVTEWNNGIETDSEMWKKTDWAQFTWAIRGKCQKVLKR